MFESLSSPAADGKLAYDDDERPLSRALFFHLARMRLTGWKHRVDFKRWRKHPLSELFQDLLAFYLRRALPDDFEISLEEASSSGKGVRKTCPDILIRKGGKNHFVIEVKTTMGWDRPGAGSPKRNLTGAEKYRQLSDRIGRVAEAFGVPAANVIYIFEGPENLDREFEDSYWDRKSKVGVARAGLPFPLSQIYPLFHGIDPYNWSGWGDRGKRQQFYPTITDAELHEEGHKRIVTSFESIVDLIRA
ncbi:McrC family protein [Caballeronia grimmiae]|uniref:hypothetical protein n=1 Tax=Caballeronia grimmiae TaxID=1071679 RepID=UPI0038BE1A1A